MNLADLNPRECKLLAMVNRGRPDEHIAKELSTTVPRVASELAALYVRLGVGGRVEASMWYGDAKRAQKREFRGLAV